MSKRGVEYTKTVLKDKQNVVTRAVYYTTSTSVSGQKQYHIKLGRYKKDSYSYNPTTLECSDPKSELTLDHEEFMSLVSLIEEFYRPLQLGEGRYIKTSLDQELALQLLGVFQDNDAVRVKEFLLKHSELLDSLQETVAVATKKRAIAEFEHNLKSFNKEYEWQKWFEVNNWVLGAGLAEVIDDRIIDPGHIADFLVQAPDGFLDIVEIKRPSQDMRCWADSRDHGNLVPHANLVKAVTQSTSYLYELEREMDSKKFHDRVGIPIAKPRATLVYGRSEGWGEDEYLAFRMLNSNYHSINIMTYDQVLSRAKSLLDAR